MKRVSRNGAIVAFFVSAPLALFVAWVLYEGLVSLWGHPVAFAFVAVAHAALSLRNVVEFIRDAVRK